MKKSRSNRTLTILAIAAGIIIGLYLVANILGAIRPYKISSNSSRPTLKEGDHILISNLVSPKRFDFICFRRTDKFEGKITVTYRLCGMPGDTVEMRSGELYINGRNTDTSLSLTYLYLLPKAAHPTLDSLFTFDEMEAPMQINDTQIIATLSGDEIKKLVSLRIPIHRSIKEKDSAQPFIEEIYHKPWNEDYFGPIILPKDNYFVLGDNRYRADDSRYIGLISKDSIVGTVIRHW